MSNLEYWSNISGGLYISVVFFSKPSNNLKTSLYFYCWSIDSNLLQIRKFSCYSDDPKSATLNLLSLNKIFSSFKSLWAIPISCIYWTPVQMSFIMARITCFGILPLHWSIMSIRVNPPWHKEQRMRISVWMFPSSVYTFS